MGNDVSYDTFLEYLERYNHPDSAGIEVFAEKGSCHLKACPTSATTLDGQPIYDCTSENSDWIVYWRTWE